MALSAFQQLVVFGIVPLLVGTFAWPANTRSRRVDPSAATGDALASAFTAGGSQAGDTPR